MVGRPLAHMSWSEEVLDDVFRDAEVGFVLLDLAGTILEANPAFCSLLGATVDEVRGASVLAFVAPDARTATAELLQQLDGERHRSYRVARDYRGPDGRNVSARVSGSTVRSRHRDLISVVELVENMGPLIKTERALWESVELYRSVVEDLDDYLVRWLPDGTRTFVNGAYARYVGRPSSELIGTSFFPLVVKEEDRDAIRAKVARLTPESPVAMNHHEATTADGSTRWHEWRDRGVFDAAGKLVSLQSIGRDVTERHRAQAALEASEKRFRRLFRDLPVACWESDWTEGIEALHSRGIRSRAELASAIAQDPSVLREAVARVQVVAVNPKALELVGAANLEEFWSLLLSSWSAVDPAVFVANVAAIAFEGDRVVTQEFRSRTKTGEPLDLVVDWARTETEESAWRIIVTAVDVTARRTAERELENQRAILEQAEAIAGLGSWEWHPARGTVLGSKNYWAVLDGTSGGAETRSDSAFFGRIHSEDRARLGERIEARADAAADDAGAPLEFRIVRPDGSTRIVVGRAIFRRVGLGNIESGFGIILDVTEQRAAEAEAERQRQELVRADKLIALGTLVSGVAHEINNPNQAIMLNAPLLESAWSAIVPLVDACAAPPTIAGFPWAEARTEMRAIAADVVAGARRIDGIVADLKGFARDADPGPGRLVAVNEALRSAQRLLAGKIRKATNHFRSNLAGDLPPVLAHRQRLEQVLVNLIQNSCNALPSAERSIATTTRLDGGDVVVEIADEGVGIEPENMGHLFDPFFTTRRAEGGMGLGLFISQRIVMELGGTLSFASRPGEGTTATLRLPAAGGGE